MRRRSDLPPVAASTAEGEAEASWSELKRNVPFLAGGVPNLGLDNLAVDLEGAGGELDADGGLGLEAELVAREA